MLSLIVGLGNPGDEYRETRHNLGFMVIDQYLKKKRGRWAEQKPDWHLATLRIKSRKLHLTKPMTYMNLSGEAIKSVCNRLDIPTKEVLVVFDDFALPYGKIRLRPSGSDGGHNGLASIIEELGAANFIRLRMGIGPVPEKMKAEDYVLKEFSKEQLDELNDFIKLGVSALEAVIYTGLPRAMNKYN